MTTHEPPVLVRDAVPQDAAGIAAIYNDVILSTRAVWREHQVDEADRAAWLAARQAASYPVLVAVVGDEVVGYASFGDFRAGDGYRHTVEHSVHVRADQRGAGVGTALLQELVERARTLGMHAMIGGIEAGNEGSIRLHERLGFRRVGTLPQVGAKHGAWLDLALLQLTLDDRPAPDDVA